MKYVVFSEGNTWYAAGLEFNIVESGDNPREALLLLFEALTGYVEAAKKYKVRPSILNQKIDPELELLWENVRTKKETKPSVFATGELNLRELVQREPAYV